MIGYRFLLNLTIIEKEDIIEKRRKNMDKINTNPPSGTRDFLPSDLKFREEILTTTKQVFESFGFLPIKTPAFERIEVLTGKYGDEGEKLIFKILKRGKKELIKESDLALRYDFTVPLARVMVQYRDKLPKIFKRYQIGPVWRADRPSKGRFREFYQADIDIVGVSSLVADIEILLVFSKVLTRLGLQDFVIHLNSRKVLAGLMKVLDIPEQFHVDILTILDKFDKIGAKEMKGELLKSDISTKVAKNIIELFKLLDSDVSVISTLEDFLRLSPEGNMGLNEIKRIIKIVTLMMKEGTIVFSPFLARGLSYYNGPIFEIYYKGLTTSIASGGRYDNLIGMFSKKSIPACGGSLGIERIVLLLDKKRQNKRESSFSQVLVTVWNEDFLQDSLYLASELRNQGLLVETYLGEEDKIGKQLRYASDMKIPFVILFGPDEKDKNKVAIKNMQTSKQIILSRDKFTDFFRE